MANVNNKNNKRVRIVGNAAIITSSLQFDTIKKLEKYNPDALVLCAKDNDGDCVEIFRIATSKVGNICKHGISFASKDKAGNATVTVLLPENVVDKREFFKNTYGNMLFILKDFEKHITEAAESVDKAFAELDEEIEEE